MNKLLWLAIILVIIGTVFWLGQSKKIEENDLINSVDAVLASTSTISQSDNFYNIRADYPQFSGVAQSFNQKITDLIEDKIVTFKQDAKDFQQARKDTAEPGEIVGDNPDEPFDFVADWTGKQINDQYISFMINIYYFSGGANGMNEVYGFNYDIQNQKEITISDFLANSNDNLQKLSALAITKIDSQLAESAGSIDESMKVWVKEGAGPKWDNFKQFSFDNNSLIIYFQKYQVAAGAFGPITIVIQKSEFEQNLINSDYLK